MVVAMWKTIATAAGALGALAVFIVLGGAGRSVRSKSGHSLLGLLSARPFLDQHASMGLSSGGHGQVEGRGPNRGESLLHASDAVARGHA